MEAGADFIKTSTGKLNPAATMEATYVMAQTIHEYYLKTGKQVGIKPAGGIATATQALEYFTLVKTILSDNWLNPALFRIGASRLVNDLLTKIPDART
ncbi:Deoxyribose-phosphate aldolase [subsurface metagenome]